MDHLYLEDEEFQAKVQIKWDQCQVDKARDDPRVRWEFAWKRIQRLFHGIGGAR